MKSLVIISKLDSAFNAIYLAINNLRRSVGTVQETVVTALTDTVLESQLKKAYAAQYAVDELVLQRAEIGASYAAAVHQEQLRHDLALQNEYDRHEAAFDVLYKSFVLQKEPKEQAILQAKAVATAKLEEHDLAVVKAQELGLVI